MSPTTLVVSTCHWFPTIASHFPTIAPVFTTPSHKNWQGHCAHYMAHHRDLIMRAMATQITILKIVYSTVYSGTDQRRHQSSHHCSFVMRNQMRPVDFPTQSVSMSGSYHLHLVASLMSPVASLVTTGRRSNVSMCLLISTKCFTFSGIVPFLHSVGTKTYYYHCIYKTQWNKTKPCAYCMDYTIFCDSIFGELIPPD